VDASDETVDEIDVSVCGRPGERGADAMMMMVLIVLTEATEQQETTDRKEWWRETQRDGTAIKF
jgi:hypothetical protein